MKDDDLSHYAQAICFLVMLGTALFGTIESAIETSTPNQHQEHEFLDFISFFLLLVCSCILFMFFIYFLVTALKLTCLALEDEHDEMLASQETTEEETPEDVQAPARKGPAKLPPPRQ